MKLSPLEQLLAFCDWEREHNPHPLGMPHVAEWAATELERLYLEVARLREYCAALSARLDVLERTLEDLIVKEEQNDAPSA